MTSKGWKFHFVWKNFLITYMGRKCLPLYIPVPHLPIKLTPARDKYIDMIWLTVGYKAFTSS